MERIQVNAVISSRLNVRILGKERMEVTKAEICFFLDAFITYNFTDLVIFPVFV